MCVCVSESYVRELRWLFNWTTCVCRDINIIVIEIDGQAKWVLLTTPDADRVGSRCLGSKRIVVVQKQEKAFIGFWVHTHPLPWLRLWWAERIMWYFFHILPSRYQPRVSNTNKSQLLPLQWYCNYEMNLTTFCRNKIQQSQRSNFTNE